MNTDTDKKKRVGMPTLIGTLFGVILMSNSGIALAATSPTVASLEFKDTKGTADPSDDTIIKIATGYGAGRVAVDGKGNLYVTDPVMDTVSVFNTNGRLVKRFNVSRAYAVGVDSSRGVVYASGALNGSRSVFILDNNDDDKDDNGNMGTAWSEPFDIAVGSTGDVYVADSPLNIVRRFNRKVNADGTETITAKDYGPYGGGKEDRYASETISGATYYRTRHRMVFPQGIALDEANGLMYVSVKEVVETLSSTVCSGGGDGSGGGNCYVDTLESWQHYNNGDTANGSSIATDSTYKYWYPVTVSGGAKYHILSIDTTTGLMKMKITTGEGDSALVPLGLALDGKGRLYVATMGGSVGIGQILVYDVSDLTKNPIPVLSPNGGFSYAQYTDVVFSPDTGYNASSGVSEAKGIFFATAGGREVVSTYSIDGGANPANTPPDPPTLIEPSARAYVSSTSPTLVIGNAGDMEKDPLTYGYEIKDGAGNVVESSGGIPGGAGGRTSMTVNRSLSDNTVYKWRAQSFDGNAASWSGEAEFCVSEGNDKPGVPAVTGPKDMAPASPFGSVLAWSPSTDPDCYDTVSYTVDLSGDQNFSTILKSIGNITVQSLSVSGMGLTNGGAYYWRVKAVDNNGAESAYDTGSFTYKTTVVRFGSDQPGTKVYIDGNYGYFGRLVGTAPVEVMDMTPGPHFVTFVKAGYEPYHTIAGVNDPLVSNTPEVRATMTPASRIKPPASGAALVRLPNIVLMDGSEAPNGSSPFVVDYNNDGLRDIVAGGRDGKVYLYISEKQVQADGTEKVVLVSKGAIQVSGADINVGSRAVPFVADYNNDQRKDLLVGSGDGTIHLFLNGGTEGSPAFSAAGTLKDVNGGSIVIPNASPSVVDYNNDGKKDLAAGGLDGTLTLYINGGTDASPEFNPADAGFIAADGIILDSGSNSRAFFTDWNSDGKKDLVVGSGGGTSYLYLNVGSDESPVFLGINALQQWMLDKKKARGNREWVPYAGYNQEIGDLTGGSGEASPFVVDWGGSTARDLVLGNGAGGVAAHITE